MRYMLLIYSDPLLHQGLSDAEQSAVYREYLQVTAEMDLRGANESAALLQPVHTATTVRVRNGETLMTDGPFAETAEHLVRYFILRCENLDQALEYALIMPDSRYGAVEIRPIQEIETPAV